MKKAFDEMETLFEFLLMKQGKHVFLNISLYSLYSMNLHR